MSRSQKNQIPIKLIANLNDTSPPATAPKAEGFQDINKENASKLLRQIEGAAAKRGDMGLQDAMKVISHVIDNFSLDLKEIILPSALNMILEVAQEDILKKAKLLVVFASRDQKIKEAFEKLGINEKGEKNPTSSPKPNSTSPVEQKNLSCLIQ